MYNRSGALRTTRRLPPPGRSVWPSSSRAARHRGCDGRMALPAGAHHRVHDTRLLCASPGVRRFALRAEPLDVATLQLRTLLPPLQKHSQAPIRDAPASPTLAVHAQLAAKPEPAPQQRSGSPATKYQAGRPTVHPYDRRAKAVAELHQHRRWILHVIFAPFGVADDAGTGGVRQVARPTPASRASDRVALHALHGDDAALPPRHVDRTRVSRCGNRTPQISPSCRHRHRGRANGDGSITSCSSGAPPRPVAGQTAGRPASAGCWLAARSTSWRP